NFLRATAPAERVEQLRIPVPFRCREGVLPLFDTVAMMQRQLLQRRPLLPVVANELPFILADRTSWRRLRVLAKLRPALYADKVLHPPPNLLPEPPRRTGE